MTTKSVPPAGGILGIQEPSHFTSQSDASILSAVFVDASFTRRTVLSPDSQGGYNTVEDKHVVIDDTNTTGYSRLEVPQSTIQPRKSPEFERVKVLLYAEEATHLTQRELPSALLLVSRWTTIKR